MSLANELNLTTYYPAPFGSYDRLKLVPRASLLTIDCDETADVGVIYYDDEEGKNSEGIYVCQKLDQDHFSWIFVSKPYASETHIDGKNAINFDKDSLTPIVSSQKVVCVKSNKTLGECLNNPSADGTCACQ